MPYIHVYFLPDNGIDQEVVAKLAEMDFIVADLERANSRVAAVERRNVPVIYSSPNDHSPQLFTGDSPR